MSVLAVYFLVEIVAERGRSGFAGSYRTTMSQHRESVRTDGLCVTGRDQETFAGNDLSST